MLVKSVLMGLALQYVPLDDLQKEAFFTVYHEHVFVEVYGKLDLTVRTDGRFRVDWDMNRPINKRNYEKAREKLALTPVPRDVT